MLVAYFITYNNGIKTMQRAEPNSSCLSPSDLTMDWSFRPFSIEQVLKSVQLEAPHVGYRFDPCTIPNKFGN